MSSDEQREAVGRIMGVLEAAGAASRSHYHTWIPTGRARPLGKLMIYEMVDAAQPMYEEVDLSRTMFFGSAV